MADASKHESPRLPFEEVKRRLEREAVDAKVSIEKGQRTIVLQVDALERDRFLAVIDVIAIHYETLEELRREPLGAHSLCADPHPSWTRREPGAGADRVRFHFDWPLYGVGATSLRVAKTTDLTEEDVECVLELWRTFGCPSGEASAEQAIEALSSLGAVVYERNEDWSWDRIAGYEAVKQRIEQCVVMPLLHPDVFRGVAEMTRTRAATNVPRAVLFEGPPGTGKTTAARVIASRAAQPLVYLPVESIMSMWYGESENRLAEVFEHAGALERSILFLDEIDAFAGSRAAQMHEATRRVLSVLLRQLQGLESSSNVLVLGATNRAGDLDAALVSRFNRIIRFDPPSLEDRAAIFRYYARQLSAADAEDLARSAGGACGRDIEDICQDAERAWATRLVEIGATTSAPPVDFYRGALESKPHREGAASERRGPDWHRA